MMRPGPRNLITDVPGLLVGNAADPRLKSGVTVLTAEAPFVAGVDVRGGAPGTRETDLLAPGRTVEAVDALVLAGGSAFGLDAASGVTDAAAGGGARLRRRQMRVPLVPAAILFDLANGGDKDWTENPYRRLGAAALAAAAEDFALGSEGAGTGAMTATLMGGLGSASFVTEAGTTVGALVGGQRLRLGGRARDPGVLGRGLRDRRRVRRARAGGGAGGAVHAAADEARSRGGGANTTIAIVATDLALDKAGGGAAGRGGAGRARPGDPSGAHPVRRRPGVRGLDRRAAGRPAGGDGGRPCRCDLPVARGGSRRPCRAAGAGQPAALLERDGDMTALRSRRLCPTAGRR